VQYGHGIKAHVVYLSQCQLLPYNRIQEYFAGQLNISISVGSIYIFNHQAYEQLAELEAVSKEHLIELPCIHADETGININGKCYWLHGSSNDQCYEDAKKMTVALTILMLKKMFREHLKIKVYYHSQFPKILVNKNRLNYR